MPSITKACDQPGGLLGRWAGDKTWQPFDPTCTLDPWPVPKLGAFLRVVLFGDSVEGLMAKDLRADNRTVCTGSAAVHICGDSAAASEACCAVQVSPVFFYGAWESGPYYANNTTPAIEVWRHVSHLHQSPDIFVISANFWDVARWEEHHPSVLELTESGRQLFQQQLALWKAHFITLLHRLQKELPNTTLIYHTTAFPALVNCTSSKHMHRGLGHREHVQQLNAAGAQIAQAAGWLVVDFVQMSAQFSEATQYLRDAHHPSPWFLRQAFQIYLNLHDQRLQASKIPSAIGMKQY
ncbi:hypothetical protein WJX79_004048 [Trebouxia sp. C0005]